MIKNSFGFVVIIFLMMACSNSSEYQKLEAKELSSGEVNDSLFLGIHFGMSSEDFYTHCWELNKKGLIREGRSNTTVYYEITDMDYPAAFEFYPLFKDQKIQSMTGYIHYVAWAPWNRHLWAERLIEDTKELMASWYGTPFIEVPSPGRGKAYTTIDGNRRVFLFYDRDERVEVLFTDLNNNDNLINFGDKQ